MNISPSFDSTSLESAYRKALSARAAGKTYVLLEIEPKPRFFQLYVRLWDGVRAKTRGRKYGPDPFKADHTVVVALYVEIDVASVINAFERMRLRAADDLARPVTAVHVQAKAISTKR